MFCSFIAILLALHGVCEGLKNLKVYVPPAIKKGETAVFICDFDLEEDQLYTLKWYKGRKEFYRYTPKEEFPIKTFTVNNVFVDKSKSNMTQLTLQSVSPALSGIYSCEVSAEAPSFYTDIKHAVMSVVEVPYQGLSIQGLRKKYAVGEPLTATCVAGASRPLVNLTWFINNDKVQKDFVQALPPENVSGNLLRAKSQINFTVKSAYFRTNGRFVLRCSGQIHMIYNQNIERIVEELEMPSETDEEVLVIVQRPGNGLTISGPVAAASSTIRRPLLILLIFFKSISPYL